MAWACAAFIDPHRAKPHVQRDAQDDGLTQVSVTHRRFGHTRINRCAFDNLMLDDVAGEIMLARMSSKGERASETLAGWPLRAFRCANRDGVTIIFGSSSIEMMSRGPNPVPDGILLEPFPRGGPVRPPAWRALPLRAIWTGLLADIAVMSAAWMMVLLAAGSARRAVRRRRGLCPTCGYRLRESGIGHEYCPECGCDTGWRPACIGNG
jgi:hypothetical protein